MATPTEAEGAIPARVAPKRRKKSTVQRLVSLDKDVWAAVAGYLQAPDVRSLRGSCRWFYVCTNQGLAARGGDIEGAVQRWKAWGAQLPSGISLKKRIRCGDFVLWQPLHAGRRSGVASCHVDGAHKAVKQPYQSSAVLDKELSCLLEANKVGVGPSVDRGRSTSSSVVMEYVDGIPFAEFLSFAPPSLARWAVRELLLQCQRLDAAGIEKGEMTHPQRHVVVCPKLAALFLIDFDKGSHVPGSVVFRNVTQVAQYLSSSRIVGLLSAHGVAVDISAVRAAAKEYKNRPQRDSLDNLIACFS
ncbi:hypothetical protein DIPPA_10686 [Diplonema papillatum]|nr:hypothetical protein DIPPA_10686 [Diplonema papillatum]